MTDSAPMKAVGPYCTNCGRLMGEIDGCRCAFHDDGPHCTWCSWKPCRCPGPFEDHKKKYEEQQRYEVCEIFTFHDDDMVRGYVSGKDNLEVLKNSLCELIDSAIAGRRDLFLAYKQRNSGDVYMGWESVVVSSKCLGNGCSVCGKPIFKRDPIGWLDGDTAVHLSCFRAYNK